MTHTTELEAVNTILATIGESPVNSLSGLLPADASQALSTLREVSRAVQTQGWSFNKEKDYPLPRDGGGSINLPASTLRVEVSRFDYPDVECVQRGTRLYDRKGHTYTFAADLVAETLVVGLEWPDLPEAARRYVTIKAARTFNDRNPSSDLLHAFSEPNEQDARRVLQADASDADDLNVLTSPGVRDILRRGAY